jgi:hypothetical protein
MADAAVATFVEPLVRGQHLHADRLDDIRLFDTPQVHPIPQSSRHRRHFDQEL